MTMITDVSTPSLPQDLTLSTTSKPRNSLEARWLEAINSNNTNLTRNNDSGVGTRSGSDGGTRTASTSTRGKPNESPQTNRSSMDNTTTKTGITNKKQTLGDFLVNNHIIINAAVARFDQMDDPRKKQVTGAGYDDDLLALHNPSLSSGEDMRRAMSQTPYSTSNSQDSADSSLSDPTATNSSYARQVKRRQPLPKDELVTAPVKNNPQTQQELLPIGVVSHCSMEDDEIIHHDHQQEKTHRRLTSAEERGQTIEYTSVKALMEFEARELQQQQRPQHSRPEQRQQTRNRQQQKSLADIRYEDGQKSQMNKKRNDFLKNESGLTSQRYKKLDTNPRNESRRKSRRTIFDDDDDGMQPVPTKKNIDRYHDDLTYYEKQQLEEVVIAREKKEQQIPRRHSEQQIPNQNQKQRQQKNHRHSEIMDDPISSHRSKEDDDEESHMPIKKLGTKQRQGLPNRVLQWTEERRSSEKVASTPTNRSTEVKNAIITSSVENQVERYSNSSARPSDELKMPQKTQPTERTSSRATSHEMRESSYIFTEFVRGNHPSRSMTIDHQHYTIERRRYDNNHAPEMNQVQRRMGKQVMSKVHARDSGRRSSNGRSQRYLPKESIYDARQSPDIRDFNIHYKDITDSRAGYKDEEEDEQGIRKNVFDPVQPMGRHKIPKRSLVDDALDSPTSPPARTMSAKDFHKGPAYKYQSSTSNMLKGGEVRSSRKLDRFVDSPTVFADYSGVGTGWLGILPAGLLPRSCAPLGNINTAILNEDEYHGSPVKSSCAPFPIADTGDVDSTKTNDTARNSKKNSVWGDLDPNGDLTFEDDADAFTTSMELKQKPQSAGQQRQRMSNGSPGSTPRPKSKPGDGDNVDRESSSSARKNEVFKTRQDRGKSHTSESLPMHETNNAFADGLVHGPFVENSETRPELEMIRELYKILILEAQGRNGEGTQSDVNKISDARHAGNQWNNRGISKSDQEDLFVNQLQNQVRLARRSTEPQSISKSSGLENVRVGLDSDHAFRGRSKHGESGDHVNNFIRRIDKQKPQIGHEVRQSQSREDNDVLNDLKAYEEVMETSGRILQSRGVMKASSKSSNENEDEICASSQVSSVQESRQDEELQCHYMYVAYSRFGDNPRSVLQLCEHQSAPQPDIRIGEVLIRVHSSTISVVDCAIRRGEWPDEVVDVNPYIVPGSALVGRVVDSSTFHMSGGLSRSGVFSYSSAIKPGDIVVSLVTSGANARFLCLAKSQLVKVPPHLDPDLTVCLVDNYLTAFQALHQGQKGGLRYRDGALKGKSILILDGYTNLGRALVEMAVVAGAQYCYALAETNQYKSRRNQRRPGRDSFYSSAGSRLQFESISRWGGIPLSKNPQDWLTLIGRKIDILVTVQDPSTSHGSMHTEYITSDHCKALRKDGQIVVICMQPGMTDEQKQQIFVNERRQTNRSPPGFRINACRQSGLEKTVYRTTWYNTFETWNSTTRDGGGQHGLFRGNRSRCAQASALSKKDLEHLIHLSEMGRIHPEVLERIPLSKVAKAHMILEQEKLGAVGHLICNPWLKQQTKTKTDDAHLIDDDFQSQSMSGSSSVDDDSEYVPIDEDM